MRIAHSPRRRLGGLLATLAVLITPLAAVTAAPAAPASAAGCYGLSCHGHDPYLYGCTISSQKFAYYYSGRTLMATVTNDYSYVCDANWAQMQLSSYAVSLGWNFQVMIEGYDTANPPFYETMCYAGQGSLSNTGRNFEACPNQNAPYNDSWTNPTWTDMMDGHLLTHADVNLWDANGNLIAQLAANQ